MRENRDARELAPAFGDHFLNRGLLRTAPEAVTGVLDVATRENPPVVGFQGCTDEELRVRRVGAGRGVSGEVHQLGIGHAVKSSAMGRTLESSGLV